MHKKILQILTIAILFFLLSLNAFALDKGKIRSNSDDFSSFAYAIDPTYSITSEDLDSIRKNPNTKFALGIALNSNYKIKDDDKKFIKENPNTLFAYGLAQNSNYKIDTNDKDYINKNPNTLLTFGLTRNPKYQESLLLKHGSPQKKLQGKESSVLFIRNFKTWLAEKNIIIPSWLCGIYGFFAGIIKAPLDFLQYNFELFDFLDKPLLEWTGWTMIHMIAVFLLLSFFLGIFAMGAQTQQQNQKK